jgi:hypothetical protein
MECLLKAVVLTVLCMTSGFSKQVEHPSTIPNAALADSAFAKSEFESGMDFALQGNLQAAVPHFKKIPLDVLPRKDQEVVQCILARSDVHVLKAAERDLDEWTAKVLDAYQTYWSNAMLGTMSADAGEHKLIGTLASLVGDPLDNGASTEMTPIEEKLKTRLSEHGYYALFGVTRPFREFMLWRKETDRTYAIDLPEGSEEVHVTMLDDFVSLGWLGFATCDYYHTGGWARPDRLYCVCSSYDLDSEDFRVSYLAHEGQHFSDYRRFPELEQPELEYRAKLVEIAMSNTTLYGLLKSFSENTSDSRNQPHAYVNRRLLHDLGSSLLNDNPPAGSWWERVSPTAIHDAGARLLKDDTRHLQHER